MLGLTSHRCAKTQASFISIKKGRHSVIRGALSYACSEEGLKKIRAELVKESKRCKERLRRLNAEGTEALLAMIIVLMDDVSLISHFVLSSLTNLAKRANLFTQSAAGNESISRAVRAVQTLASFGLVETEKAVFNPFDKHCEVKNIKLTSKFFILLGISPKKINKTRCELIKEVVDRVVDDNDSRVLADEFKIKETKKVASLERMQERRAKLREAMKDSLFSGLAA